MFKFIILGIIIMVIVHGIFKLICDVIDSIQTKRDKKKKEKEWQERKERFWEKYGRG